MAKLRQLNYTISYGPIEDEHVTPAIANLMEELHYLANVGVKEAKKKIEDAIVKYPNLPQFKNYLSIWYRTNGKHKECVKVNADILKKHPEYLFARVNCAIELLGRKDLSEKELSKVTDLLGESFELKDLYPNRDVFHIGEVDAMLSIAIQYYVFKGDLEQANVRLDILKQVNPDSETITIFEQFISELTSFFNESKLGFNEGRTTIEQPKTRKKLAPKFKLKEIEVLYSKDVLEQEDIAVLLSLPRISLIEDLEAVLKDSIRRYSHFEKSETIIPGLNMVMSSLLLLRELKAIESLPTILNVLAQSEEYLDMYIGEALPEFGWLIIYDLGQDQTDLLLEYVKKPLIYTYSKDCVSTAITQMAVYNPTRREEMIAWLKDVMKYYITGDEDLVDIDYMELLIGNIVDLQAKELMPEIKKLYKLDYVSAILFSDVEHVKDCLTGDVEETLKQDFMIMNEIIEELHGRIEADWGYEEDDDFEEDDFAKDVFNDFILKKVVSQQMVNTEKINRNDPCPCGSGKKYKKCCLLKNTNA